MIKGHEILENVCKCSEQIPINFTHGRSYKYLPFDVTAKIAKLQQETVGVTQCEVNDVEPKPKEAINEIKTDLLHIPPERLQKWIDLQLKCFPSSIPKEMPKKVLIFVHPSGWTFMDTLEPVANTEPKKLPKASPIDIQSIMKLLEPKQFSKLRKMPNEPSAELIYTAVKSVKQTQCTKYENQSYVITVKRLCAQKIQTYVNFVKQKPAKSATITKNINKQCTSSDKKSRNTFNDRADIASQARLEPNAKTEEKKSTVNDIAKKMQDGEQNLAETKFKPDCSLLDDHVDTSKPLQIAIEEDDDAEILNPIFIPKAYSPTKKNESWDRFLSEVIAMEKVMKMSKLPTIKATTSKKKPLQPKCHTTCGTKKDNKNTKVDCPTNSNLNKLETIIDNNRPGCSSSMMLEMDY